MLANFSANIFVKLLFTLRKSVLAGIIMIYLIKSLYVAVYREKTAHKYC